MKLRRIIVSTLATMNLLIMSAESGRESLTLETENYLRYLYTTNIFGAETKAIKAEIRIDSTQSNTTHWVHYPTPPPPEPEPTYIKLLMEATAYVSFCDTGCIGITKGGTDVRKNILHPSGYPIVAVDPRVIPLGTIVEIEGKKYIADDTGGAIKGNKIDILVHTTNTSLAYQFGRKTIEVIVYK